MAKAAKTARAVTSHIFQAGRVGDFGSMVGGVAVDEACMGSGDNFSVVVPCGVAVRAGTVLTGVTEDGVMVAARGPNCVEPGSLPQIT